MPRARIITDNPENASVLIRRLESKGYTVQVVPAGEVCEDAADLEIELEKLPSRDALAEAARLSQGAVFVAPNCLDLPPAEPEEVPLAERLLERAEAAEHLEAASADHAVPPAGVPLRSKVAGAAVRVSDGLRGLRSISGGFLRQTGARAEALLRDLEKGIEARSGSLMRNWRVLRDRQLLVAQRRREDETARRQEVELQRNKRRLQEQEELRQQLTRRRLAEEERERHRQLQEQLQRLQQAEEEERRQQACEAQLERQRLDALKLAEERERVVRERAERARQAEEARLQRLQEAEQQRYEREQARLQQIEALAVTPEGGQQARAQETHGEGNTTTDNPAQSKAEESAVPAEPVLTYNLPERSRRSRWESDLNSPYHPAWSWAAAAAGAVTVAIMLLWTALGTSRSSVVRFTPVAPSSLLPVHTQIQQQLPFGPVKLTLQKAVPAAAAAVPAKAAVVQERTAIKPPPAPALHKPSAEKPRPTSSRTVDWADSGPDVVVRHFNVSAKVQTPAARQTATIKHYSDLN